MNGHDRLLWIKNTLTLTRILILALATWFSGLFLLWIDGFAVDSAAILTIMIGMFSLILALSVQVARSGQKIDDIGEDLLAVKGYVFQLLQDRGRKKYNESNK